MAWSFQRTLAKVNYKIHTDAIKDRLVPPRLTSMQTAYQIRNALKARNASGDSTPVNLSPFEQAYQALSDKLRPQVFSLGFLR